MKTLRPRAIVPTVVCGALLGLVLTGCISTPSVPEHDTSPAPANAQATPNPTPTASSSSAPTNSAISTGNFELTAQGGYTATLTYNWHAAVPATYAQLADLPSVTPSYNCAQMIASEAALIYPDPSRLSYLRVEITGSIDYPMVNGFQWPKNVGIWTMLNRASGSSFSVICGTISAPAPGTPPSFDTSIVFYAPQTPNDPNGTIRPSLSDLQFKVYLTPAEIDPRNVSNYPI